MKTDPTKLVKIVEKLNDERGMRASRIGYHSSENEKWRLAELAKLAVQNR